jgi:hypothetical protein
MKPTIAAASLCLCLPCMAQPSAAAASAPAAAASRPALTRPDGPPQRGGEPQVQRTVTEGRSARIDELRVRGITQRVVVQPTLAGAPAYEISSTSDGRDTSQDRRTEGRSLFQVLSF